MNYAQINFGDYANDTGHLTFLEHGIYWKLLQLYYTAEGPIAATRVERLVGVRTDEEKQALANVLEDFFTLEEGVWRQSRCDKDIADYQAKRDKNTVNGRQGGRPRKIEEGMTEEREEAQFEPSENPTETQTKPLGFSGLSNENPNETQTKGNHKPITNNQEPITNLKTHTQSARGRVFRLPPESETPKPPPKREPEPAPRPDPAPSKGEAVDGWEASLGSDDPITRQIAESFQGLPDQMAGRWGLLPEPDEFAEVVTLAKTRDPNKVAIALSQFRSNMRLQVKNKQFTGRPRTWTAELRAYLSRVEPLGGESGLSVAELARQFKAQRLAKQAVGE